MTNISGWTRFSLFNLVIFGALIAMYQLQWVAVFVTYPGLLVAMSAGFMGATFSMLIQNKQRVSEGTLDDLIAASSWYTLMVRGSVGLGAAAILYFFFESGLLEGSLWPDLTQLGFNKIKTPAGELAIESSRVFRVPNQHWCLLVVWCFLAGFSETLVPNILQKTEQKGAEK